MWKSVGRYFRAEGGGFTVVFVFRQVYQQVTMELALIADRAAEEFHRHFGRPSEWTAVAPGRVNLIGEHTDYNDGFVLPMAIERYVVIAAARAPSSRAVVRSAQMDCDFVLDLKEPVRPCAPQWGNYLRGVVAGFQRRGMNVPGFEAVIDSTIPLGGGLSSSAALEVAMASLCEVLTAERLSPVDKALLCQQAEQDFAGVPCGIMDQFVSTLAQEDHLLLLDCRSRKGELIPLRDPEVSILVIDTSVRHELQHSDYATRRWECETVAASLNVPALRDIALADLENARDVLSPLLVRRARHVVSEIARTLNVAEALRAQDWLTVGRMMYESHHSLQEDYEVSCRELNVLVEEAQSIGVNGGVFGCRMTGGGFGGCVVALVRTENSNDIMRVVSERYFNRTGLRASAFVSRPAGGARILVRA